MPQYLKLGSSLPSRLMHVCNLKDMSEDFELLISKHVCMRTLKKKIEEI